MNNKDKFLYSLHKARMEHTKWLSKMRILATGTIDEEALQHKNFFETHFAKWFQEKAIYLLSEHSLTSLKEIEKLILHLDGEHTLLYNVAVKNRSKTILGKIKPFSTNEEASAEKYFNAIKIITEKIETLLEEANSRLQNIDEKKFAFMSIVSAVDTEEIKPSVEKAPKEKLHGGARGAWADGD